MIKILIVEDELIIAEDLANSLRKMNYEVSGIAKDYFVAMRLIEQNIPDLMLLDINLGGKKDGIELAQELNQKYKIAIIFTTSYADSATLERAKKVNPINYLVKPFTPDQLFTAIEIAMYGLANKIEKPVAEIEEDSINEGLIIKDALFLKEKFRYTKLPIADILWIKAEGNYLEIHLADKKELIRASLSAFLEKINRKNFFRTHKSYVVNLDYLTKFEPTAVTILNTEIPISKNYSDELLRRLEVI